MSFTNSCCLSFETDKNCDYGLNLQDASLLRFLVDMRGADVDDRQVSSRAICQF